MANVDIFNSAKEKVMPEWAKFNNAGDAYQGTYVGKIVGQIDGYGNEQVIYQLLRDDGTVVNVGFGLNKKVLHQDMSQVKFGQIVGFKYKGTLAIKDKYGKQVNVKDFALYQDPKIVDAAWLKENEDNMPVVTKAVERVTATEEGDSLSDLTKELNSVDVENLSSEDKLAAITKLAQDKFQATDANSVKESVMNSTGKAFIPVNYDAILKHLIEAPF